MTIIAGVVIATLFGTARADSPPDPRLHAIAQDGQDVAITVWHYHHTMSGYRIDALRGDAEPTQVAMLDLDSSYASPSDQPRCSGYDYECYEDEPDPACFDCDDDGFAECISSCDTTWFFDLTLRCVEPGLVEYQLVDDDWGFDVDSMTFEVADTADACLSEGSVQDEDAGRGCSTTPFVPRLAILLSLAGLALLVPSRRA